MQAAVWHMFLGLDLTRHAGTPGQKLHLPRVPCSGVHLGGCPLRHRLGPGESSLCAEADVQVTLRLCSMNLTHRTVAQPKDWDTMQVPCKLQPGCCLERAWEATLSSSAASGGPSSVPSPAPTFTPPRNAVGQGSHWSATPAGAWAVSQSWPRVGSHWSAAPVVAWALPRADARDGFVLTGSVSYRGPQHLGLTPRQTHTSKAPRYCAMCSFRCKHR